MGADDDSVGARGADGGKEKDEGAQVGTTDALLGAIGARRKVGVEWSGDDDADKDGANGCGGVGGGEGDADDDDEHDGSGGNQWRQQSRGLGRVTGGGLGRVASSRFCVSNWRRAQSRLAQVTH